MKMIERAVAKKTRQEKLKSLVISLPEESP
jgi:hypothetical protein